MQTGRILNEVQELSAEDADRLNHFIYCDGCESMQTMKLLGELNGWLHWRCPRCGHQIENARLSL